jgi:iron complex outermembrane receptor protein
MMDGAPRRREWLCGVFISEPTKQNPAMKNPALTLLAAAFVAASVPAQTPPLVPEDPIQLSEFRVNSTTDRGYVATQAAGATRTNTPLIELAHTVNVLNTEFVKDTGAEKLYDALRYVSNVTGGDVRNDGDFGAPALGVRGFAINRMRDGMNVTSASALVELSGYERIEAVKGASAVQLGSSNPGGILNYVPKTPLFRPRTEIAAQLASDNFYRGSIDTTGPLFRRGSTRAAYRVVVSAEDSESFMDYHNRDLRFIQTGLAVHVGRDTQIVVRFETQQETTRESIGMPYAYFVNSVITPQPILMNLPIGFYRGETGDRKKAYTHILDLTADTRLNDQWSLNFKSYGARAYTDRLETFILNPGPTTPITAWARGTQRIPSLTRALAAEANLLGNFDLGTTRHRFLAGLTTLGNEGSGTNERWDRGTINPYAPVYGITPLGPKTVNLSTESTNNYYGAYVQDQAKFFRERLIATAGVRWDYAANSGLNRINNVTTATNLDKISPRYSLLYRVVPELSLYGSYNESFQPAPAGTDIRGNRFQPLQGLQYEAGGKFTFLGGKISGNFAAYEIKLENSITQDRTAPGFGVQGGVTSSNGYETDLAWSPQPGFQVIGSWGMNKFRRNAEIETPLAGREAPMWQYKVALWGKYDWLGGALKGFAAGLGVVHEGERHGEFDRRFRVPGYTVLNGLVSYEWGRYRAAMNIENLLDDRNLLRIEEARLSNFGAPLSFKLSLSARF